MSINEKNSKKSLVSRDNGTGLSSLESEKDNDISQEILSINKENNRLLKKVVRYQKWEAFFSLLKILFIIVPLVFAYIYLAPMLSQVIKSYQSALGSDNGSQTTADGLKGLGNVNVKDQLKELLK